MIGLLNLAELVGYVGIVVGILGLAFTGHR